MKYFFFEREKAERENADTTCYLPTFCNHVFNVRRIVMHLIHTDRPHGDGVTMSMQTFIVAFERKNDSIENEQHLVRGTRSRDATLKP